jgi:hypothetical protein
MEEEDIMADEKIPGRIPVEGVQPETGALSDNLIRSGDKIRVMVEIRVPKDRDKNFAFNESMFNLAATLGASGFTIDPDFPPTKVSPKPDLAPSMEEANEESIMIRGTIPQDRIEDLKRQPKVIDAVPDNVVQPFVDPSL